MDPQETPSGAIFSEDGLYRFLLWRRWDLGRLQHDLEAHEPRWLVSCCLNCSTADAMKNDPTVAGMVKRAKSWGYDGFKMVNLFAYRSTNPKGLLSAQNPVGAGNDAAILEACRLATTVICGWGSASPLIPARAKYVEGMLRASGVELHHLRLNKDGQPGHPLYIGHDIQPTRWLLPS